MLERLVFEIDFFSASVILILYYKEVTLINFPYPSTFFRKGYIREPPIYPMIYR